MSLSVNKNSKHKKSIIVAAILAVTLLLLGASIYYFIPRDEKTDTTQTTESQDDAPVEEPTIDNDEQLVPDQTIPQNGNPDQQPTKETARINIPNYQATGRVLTVNAAVSEPWSDDAQCVMNITGPTSATINEKLFAQAQISGCQLRSPDLQPGAYVVTIHAEQGSNRTNTETLNITIK